MPAISASRAQPQVLERVRRVTPSAAAFLAGAGPVALLGFSRGGYPVEVIAGYGVALWWLLLVGFLTGAIPRPRPTRAGWIALFAITALAVWGGVSLSWTADRERGLTEVVRLIVAGGSLLLGMSAVRAGQARSLVAGVFAGLSGIVVMAVLTRLIPGLIPDAAQTGEFLRPFRLRLAWPLNYWNAVGSAAAIALALAVALAARARTVWGSAAAAATVPSVSLGLVFTLSRGGMIAAAVALIFAVVVIAPRPMVLRAMVAPAIGGAVAIFSGLQASDVAEAVGGAAQADAGRSVLATVITATVGVGLLQAGLRTADRAHWTPVLPRPSRRASVVVLAIAIVAVAAGALALGASNRVSGAWDRFQDTQITDATDTDNSTARLSSFSGAGRYQLWDSALEATSNDPLRGLGLGSFEVWWNQHRGRDSFVRNAHSEPLELLAETGLVGGSLFLIFLLAPLTSGTRTAFRRGARSAHHSDAVLVVPALVAFSIGLFIDWNWQIGAVAVAGSTLAAATLSRATDDSELVLETGPTRRGGRWRRPAAVLAAVGVSAASVATLALALIAPQAVDASRSALADGDTALAVAEAAKGESAAKFAATPSLQRALVEEQAGNLGTAEAAARRAAARTPDDWRPWFLIARLATARGNDEAAVMAFRRARRLNPTSRILAP
jgi:tetratricopeptide (TPR) repeat protein